MERREQPMPQEESVMHDLPLKTANYKILLLGFALIVLGFVLMSGGASEDPSVFSYEIFSWRRITLAPIVVVIGFIVEIYAIMKK